MSKTAHTPGPWICSDGDIVPANDESDPIVTLYLDTSDANARLIAAAPDLLDALENLTIAIGMGWDLDGVVEVSRAAIARAKGEA